MFYYFYFYFNIINCSLYDLDRIWIFGCLGPGHANTVCNAIDNLNMDEILGTVAGDNCMFACLREGVSGDAFMAKLKRLIPGIDD